MKTKKKDNFQQKEREHGPSKSTHKKLEQIPEISGNVLRIYAQLKKFDKSKEKTTQSFEEIPYLGPYKDSDGTIYYGQMKKGKKHGYGKQIDKEGSIYEGFWENDEPAYYGRNIFKEGEAYEGYMNSEGLFHGNGKFINEDGQIYMGEYKNDEKHGKGCDTWPNGDKFEGTYVEGKR